MKSSANTTLQVLLFGGLAVAVVLTVIAVGVTHPLPWVLLAALVAIPLFNKYRDRQKTQLWKEEYSVGIASIDEEHKQLLRLINRFQTGEAYDVGGGTEKEMLDELIDYAQNHFQHEEQLMELYDYPELNSHREEHLKMAKQVDQFVEDYRQRGPKVLGEIVHFLNDWLINHILVVDKKYSDYLRERGAK